MQTAGHSIKHLAGMLQKYQCHGGKNKKKNGGERNGYGSKETKETLTTKCSE